jgi:hypothetical protein
MTVNGSVNQEPMSAWAATFLEWAPLIVGLGLLGIALIVALVVIRHVFRRWERQARRREKQQWRDVWATSGQRLQVDPADDRRDEGEEPKSS